MSLRMRKGLSDLLGKHIDGKVLGIFIALSIALAWIPDGLVELFSGKYFKGTIMIVVSIVILVVIYRLIVRLRKQYDDEEVADISPLSDATSKKALILFLSNHGNLDELNIPKNLSQTELAKNKKDRNLGNWQMPLKAIHFHASRLERCVVLTSPESDEQIETFKEIVRNLFGDRVIIETRKIEKIEDLDTVIDGYRQAFRRLKNIEKFPEEEIVIDVTSGTKLVSIAGSFYALAKDRLIQYVDNDYTVIMFNNHAIPD